MWVVSVGVGGVALAFAVDISPDDKPVHAHRAQ